MPFAGTALVDSPPPLWYRDSRSADLVGDRLGVGRQVLALVAGVRILLPQPILLAHGGRPHRLEAQDTALSRLKHGFESRWGHHSKFSSDFAPRILIPPCRDQNPSLLPRRIKGADDLLQVRLRQPRVDRRRLDVGVPQMVLHRAQIAPRTLQKLNAAAV